MIHGFERRTGLRLQPVVQIDGGRERLHPLRAALAAIRRLLADQQGDLMPALDQVIGEFGAETARGKIGEPARLVQGFVSRAGGDDAIHTGSPSFNLFDRARAS